MAVAFDYMNGIKRYGKRLPGRVVAALKADVSRRISERPVSEETRKKQSKAKLGKKLSAEHVEKVRLAVLGRKMGPEFAAKVSEAKRGRGNGRIGFVVSEETRNRISDANRNRPIIVCPHCDKSVKDHGGAKRWHFDKCKERIAA